MNNNMNDKLFELYVLAELKYKKHFNNVNDDDLFPSGWYGNKNYQKKIVQVEKDIDMYKAKHLY